MAPPETGGFTSAMPKHINVDETEENEKNSFMKLIEAF